MTLRQRILAVVGALALLWATPSMVLGNGNDHVDTSSITILPGPLAANLTWVSREVQTGGPTLSGRDGYFVLRVLDERGYATGWTVSLSTTDGSGTVGHLGNEQLALSPGAVSVIRGNPNLAGHLTFGLDPVSSSPSLVWSVPDHSGDGEYNLPLGGTLGMPDDQPRNNLYTVIVNIDGVAP